MLSTLSWKDMYLAKNNNLHNKTDKMRLQVRKGYDIVIENMLILKTYKINRCC